MHPQSSRRELLDDDFVEFPFLGWREEVLFFQDMADNLTFELSLMIEDVRGHCFDPVAPDRGIEEKEVREFGPLSPKITPDSVNAGEKCAADLLHLFPLFA